MRERLARYLDELSQVGVSIATLSTRLEVAPNASDDRIRVALLALEDASQALALARNESARLDEDLAKARREQDATQAQLRDVRRDHFRNARLHVRDSLIAGILAAIPEYAQLLRKSKEQKLSALLKSSLETLWHKTKRLSSVDVNFAECTIDLRGPEGPISRSDLSAAEKQLFAISFIFSLANLSDRRLPFAIDTPLARLDRQHRQNLVTTFLPAASHQTILFSTDTEVVGKLLEDASQFIARRYELADYNEGLTEPVLAEASL
jgi:DNA sulfur modification protein DndD